MISMKVHTQVGIEVEVSDEIQNTTILMFEKPIRAIQLTTRESNELGLMLLKAKKIVPTHIIKKLKTEGFFDSPKNFNQIKFALEDRGIPIKPAILGGVLFKLVKNGEIKRKQTEEGYRYF
jgi:hypothetical protein